MHKFVTTCSLQKQQYLTLSDFDIDMKNPPGTINFVWMHIIMVLFIPVRFFNT
jgi:hypothetical protein